MVLFTFTPVSALELRSQHINFPDMPDDWSTVAIVKGIDNELVRGIEENGTLRIGPSENLKRAEMAAVITRAFGATEKADISGVYDILSDDWFPEDMAKSVKMEAFKLDYLMRPNDNITRQEVFVVLARVFMIKSEDKELAGLNTFYDKDLIEDWARAELCGMAEAGYIEGFNGMLLPLEPISRAEFAVVMDNLVKQYISEPGSITELATNGNIVVRSAGVTLKDIAINGDLFIADGVGNGKTILDGVTVKGRLVVRNSDPNSVIIRGDSVIGCVDACELVGDKEFILNTTGNCRVLGTEGTLEGYTKITGCNSFVILNHLLTGNSLFKAKDPINRTPQAYDSAEKIERIWVTSDKAVSFAAGLLDKEVQVTSNRGTKGTATIDWEIPEYSTGKAIRYQAIGTLKLPKNWTGNPTVGAIVSTVFDVDGETITQYNGTKIENLIVPSKINDTRVSIVGVRLFTTNEDIESVEVKEGLSLIELSAFQNCINLVRVTLPESITTIESHAFCDCSSLPGIVIPGGVTSISGSAFKNCSKLENVTIPTISSLTAIGSEAFNGCLALKTINIPDGIASIGDTAFYGCTSLNHIEIPTSIDTIENAVFGSCKSLTHIKLPNTIKSIGANAFIVCTSLTSIAIPEGVTTIGNNAFEGCKVLQSITIPAITAAIGSSAFRDCTSLATVNMKGTDGKTIGEQAFLNCTSLATIKVSSSKINILDVSIIKFRTAYITGATSPAIGVPGTYTKSGTSWYR